MGGLLEVEGLRRTFGSVVALDGLTFSVPSGQVVGFLGPNGAGKTTTMRSIFGLTDLDAGVVRWDGTPVRPRVAAVRVHARGARPLSRHAGG